MSTRTPSQNIFTVLFALYYRLQNSLWRWCEEWAHLHFNKGMKATPFKVGMAAVILKQHELGWQDSNVTCFLPSHAYVSPRQLLVGLQTFITSSLKKEYKNTFQQPEDHPKYRSEGSKWEWSFSTTLQSTNNSTATSMSHAPNKEWKFKYTFLHNFIAWYS